MSDDLKQYIILIDEEVRDINQRIDILIKSDNERRVSEINRNYENDLSNSFNKKKTFTENIFTVFQYTAIVGGFQLYDQQSNTPLSLSIYFFTLCLLSWYLGVVLHYNFSIIFGKSKIGQILCLIVSIGFIIVFHKYFGSIAKGIIEVIKLAG